MPAETLTSLIDRLPPVVNRGVLAQILARLTPGAQCSFVSTLLEIVPQRTGEEWAIDMQMSENADPEIGRLLASLLQP